MGDFINTTPLIAASGKADVLISGINTPLARHDQHIEQIFEIEKYKTKNFGKWRLIWHLYLQGYDRIFVVMPNAFNLCVARLSCAKNRAALDVVYKKKWYIDILLRSFSTVQHDKKSLALKSYLDLVDPQLAMTDYPKYATWPLFIPPKPIQTKQAGFHVGINLSAGNQLKTLPQNVWRKIAIELNKYEACLWVFGLAHEHHFLAAFEQYSGFPGDKIVDLTGRVDLHELPYYLSLVDLYISSDTGNAYIADSLNVPVINFMGPCNAAEQRPLGDQALVIETIGLQPFSFIFQAPYTSDLTAEALYLVSDEQWQKIRHLISHLGKAAQFSGSSASHQTGLAPSGERPGQILPNQR